MFKNMRRQDRKVEAKQVIDRILSDGEYGVLSTIGENGYPYGVPVNYVYLDNTIYFHCAKEGYKLDNMKYSNKVSFCVVGSTEVLPEEFSTEYESVIAFGKAEEARDDEKEKALIGLIDKYSKVTDEGLAYIRKASGVTKVVKIQIEHITGKARG